MRKVVVDDYVHYSRLLKNPTGSGTVDGHSDLCRICLIIVYNKVNCRYVPQDRLSSPLVIEPAISSCSRVREVLTQSQLDFDDDLALLSHTQRQIQQRTDNVAEHSARPGLNIHRRKSKILKLNQYSLSHTGRGSDRRGRTVSKSVSCLLK